MAQVTDIFDFFKGVEGNASEFEIISEFDWGAYRFENKSTLSRHPVLSSVSRSNVPQEDDTNFYGYCRQYAFRDVVVTRRQIYEATSAPVNSSSSLYAYNGNIFKDDISVDQILDENWGDVDDIFKRAVETGVASKLHYEHVAIPIPNQKTKDTKGCYMLKVSDFGKCSKTDPQFSAKVCTEICERGPIFGTFACYRDISRMASSFMYIPQSKRTLTVRGSYKVQTHAVMVTGYGKAKLMKNNSIIDYLVVQNNWGNYGNVVARMPISLFGLMYCPVFEGQISLPQFVAQSGNEVNRLVRV